MYKRQEREREGSVLLMVESSGKICRLRTNVVEVLRARQLGRTLRPEVGVNKVVNSRSERLMGHAHSMRRPGATCTLQVNCHRTLSVLSKHKLSVYTTFRHGDKYSVCLSKEGIQQRLG